MKDDYRIDGQTKELKVNLESEVVDVLIKMAAHTKYSVSELTNVALKRFISHHKDFLPPGSSS